RSDSLARIAAQAVERALSLAPRRAETLYAQARFRWDVKEDWQGALEALEQSRSIAPGDVDVLSLLGYILVKHGRSDEGTSYLAEAVRLDPLSLAAAREYAIALFTVKRFHESDSVAGIALLRSPDNMVLINARLEARAAQGDARGLRAVLREALRHIDPVRLVLEQWGTYWMLDDSLRVVAR